MTEPAENRSDEPHLEDPEEKKKLSFTEQLTEARKNSDGAFSFLMSALAIVSVTAGCTALMILLLLLPIFVFVVGLVNMGNCPVNPWIPTYLVSRGSTEKHLECCQNLRMNLDYVIDEMVPVIKKNIL